MSLDVLGEIVLAAACAWASLCSWRSGSWLKTAGFLILGLAAFAGALQYGGMAEAGAAHRYLTMGASRIGLVLIALGMVLANTAWLIAIGVSAVLLVVPEFVALLASVLALIAIAYTGWSTRSWSLIVGAALFLIAALVVGAQGQWFGIPRMVIYHVALAVAIVALAPSKAATAARVGVASS